MTELQPIGDMLVKGFVEIAIPTMAVIATAVSIHHERNMPTIEDPHPNSGQDSQPQPEDLRTRLQKLANSAERHLGALGARRNGPQVPGM